MITEKTKEIQPESMSLMLHLDELMVYAIVC